MKKLRINKNETPTATWRNNANIRRPQTEMTHPRPPPPPQKKKKKIEKESNGDKGKKMCAKYYFRQVINRTQAIFPREVES